jgi:hypothetical protein
VAESTNKVAVGVLNRDHLESRRRALLSQAGTAEAVFDLLNREATANPAEFYVMLDQAPAYWLEPAESPAVTERLDKIVGQVERALPNFLALTNQLHQVLSNSATATAHLDQISSNLVPASADLTRITAQLREPGGLGSWALGTNGPPRIESTLAGTDRLLANADSNLVALSLQIGQSLDNLAGITSNLNLQVQQNTNLLSSISDAIIHADDLVQGLKRHWLLRSAFKDKPPATNAPGPMKVLKSPRDAEPHR